LEADGFVSPGHDQERACGHKRGCA
jgi:hypothetical protein